MSLLRIYLRPEWPRVVVLGALLCVGIGLQLVNPQIVRAFIDRAQAGASLDQLSIIALVFIAVAVLTQVATIVETYVADTLSWRTTNALRADLTRHVVDLDGSFHAEHTPGELIERIDGDVSAIATVFSHFVVHVLGSGVFLVGVLVLLWREDWRVGALLSVCALAAIVFMTRGGGFVARRARTTRKATADLTSALEEQLGALPDLKSSGADAYAMRRLHQLLATRYQRIGSSVMAGSLFNGVVGLIFVVGAGAALGVSTLLTETGALTLGGVYLVFRYTSMLQEPLQRLMRQMNSFLTATGSTVRLRELLDTRSRVVDGPGARFPSGALSVELDDVTFTYAAEPVLRHVSFRLEPGEVLGLLGRTGSGKTTVSRLLFRLHDPTAGVVQIGGLDIRAARLDQLRERIGLVTQDVQLFEGTLRDNVTLFDPDVPDARLLDVFSQLGLETWLRRLPDGLHTRLGAAERGLSAGEEQLVALARVFLKDPGVVVLDEASSRLDPDTEQLLEQAVTRLLNGRTGLIIAHRLATVERAQRIVILDDGCVAELGLRTELAHDPSSRFARLLRAGMAEALA